MVNRIEAILRKEKGKRKIRRLRKKGYLPGIVYGPGTEPVPVFMRKIQFEKIFHHITETTPFELIIKENGKELYKKKVFIKMIQRDKVTDEIVHVDFYEPIKGHVMKINIPVKLEGKAIGVEKGGVLEVLYEEILVETEPDRIPEYIEIDISSLDLGESLHVRDLKFPEGVKPLLHPEEPVVTILIPKGLEVTEEEEEIEEEVEEPEVIKKGKGEEEEKTE